MSWGILQFNGTSTWNEMERRFNFYGDPKSPPDAIHMADMMISSGLIGRWTCARSYWVEEVPLADNRSCRRSPSKGPEHRGCQYYREHDVIAESAGSNALAM